MGARARSRRRFARRVPGEAFWTPRPLAQRMYDRAEETEVERVLCGDTVTVVQTDTRRIRRTVDPSPNAPLLIRLNTHPYALSRGYPKRLKLLEGRDPEARERPETVPLMQQAAEAINRPVSQNPIRAIDHIPCTPRVVSVDEWLSEREP